MKTFPALSIRQPWADLILDGKKNIENRPRWSRFRGNILVHASLTIDFEGAELHRRKLGLRSGEDYDGETGAILGMVEIVDVVRDHKSTWFGGPYCVGLVLRNPVRFRRPIPFSGALGVFRVPLRRLEGTMAHRAKPGELIGEAVVARRR